MLVIFFMSILLSYWFFGAAPAESFLGAGCSTITVRLVDRRYSRAVFHHCIGRKRNPWPMPGSVPLAEAAPGDARLHVSSLFDVENGIALEKWDFHFDFVAGLFVGLLSCNAVRVDDERAFLALANMSVELHGLFESHPDGSREVLRHGACPQRKNVDSAVGLAIVAEARNPSCCMLGVPRPAHGLTPFSR
jgi:hypothetical protein